MYYGLSQHTTSTLIFHVSWLCIKYLPAVEAAMHTCTLTTYSCHDRLWNTTLIEVCFSFPLTMSICSYSVSLAHISQYRHSKSGYTGTAVSLFGVAICPGYTKPKPTDKYMCHQLTDTNAGQTNVKFATPMVTEPYWRTMHRQNSTTDQKQFPCYMFLQGYCSINVTHNSQRFCFFHLQLNIISSEVLVNVSRH